VIVNRIIPCLLLRGGGFYKTTQFKKPVYLGDPLNILRIFNEKEVDEIAILDIAATVEQRAPNYELLQDLASECFMPLAYGGGVRTSDQIKRLVQIGFEKVILNSAAVERPDLITAAAKAIGSQSVLVCIDARKTLLGRYEVMTHGATRKTGLKPEEWARQAAERGAGEVLVNAVDRDGTMTGYDLELVSRVADAVGVPVVASGGARSVNDFAAAVAHGASACAAGAMFVFQGRHRAVLINVPSRREIVGALASPSPSALRAGQG
jgi:imidazole glycerol-phosphate synthase subunit HisF